MSTSQLVNTILKKSFDSTYRINSMKLQKLTFLVYKKYYDTYHENILHEPFSVWQYGPVLVSVYEYYKNLGAENIKTYMKDSHGKAYAYSDNHEIQNIVDEVWDDYHSWTTHDLAERTRMPHEEWWNAYQNDRTIIEFF